MKNRSARKWEIGFVSFVRACERSCVSAWESNSHLDRPGELKMLSGRVSDRRVFADRWLVLRDLT